MILCEDLRDMADYLYDSRYYRLLPTSAGTGTWLLRYRGSNFKRGSHSLQNTLATMRCNFFRRRCTFPTTCTPPHDSECCGRPSSVDHPLRQRLPHRAAVGDLDLRGEPLLILVEAAAGTAVVGTAERVVPARHVLSRQLAISKRRRRSGPLAGVRGDVNGTRGCHPTRVKYTVAPGPRLARREVAAVSGRVALLAGDARAAAGEGRVRPGRRRLQAVAGVRSRVRTAVILDAEPV